MIKRPGKLIFLSVLSALFLCACKSTPGPPAQPPEPQYDQIIVINDIKNYSLLSVPDNEQYIIKYIDNEVLTIKVIRTLDFPDPVPAPEKYENIKHNMGCACQKNGRTFTLATFGEFESEKGKGSMVLLIEVPLGLIVEKQKKLHGPQSKAMDIDPDVESDLQPVFTLKKGWSALHSTSLEGREWSF